MISPCYIHNYEVVVIIIIIDLPRHQRLHHEIQGVCVLFYFILFYIFFFQFFKLGLNKSPFEPPKKISLGEKKIARKKKKKKEEKKERRKWKKMEQEKKRVESKWCSSHKRPKSSPF